MDDAFVVSRGESPSDLRGVIDCRAQRQRTLTQLVAKGPALQDFRNQVRTAILAGDTVYRQNVRMIELRNRAGFDLETRQSIGISSPGGGKHLDGDITAERRVTRPPDLAHSARTER